MAEEMSTTKKTIIILLSALVLIITCHISEEANIKYVAAAMIYGVDGIDQSNIIFSKDSGFYNDEFSLRIYAPTEEIYYTLDGSEPDKNSMKYTEAILINDATMNPNVHSMYTDVCAEFEEELVLQYSEKKMDYQVPDYNVDKCTVVRAVFYDEQGEKSELEERVYFVGYDERSGYDDVNIITITTEPENLFSDESGIYVLGDTFEEYLDSGELGNSYFSDYWYWWNGNFRNKGIEWERESSIQVFNTSKELVLSQVVGIRIQGGGSRGFLPKSLNIYAREEYGNARLEYDFWGTGYQPKRMTLTSGGDDIYTKVKDRLVSELSQDYKFEKMNYEPYVLFLNGEYWGFYYLTEKYDTQYIEEHYDIDDGTEIDDIIIMKNGVVETGVEADYYVSYSEMQEFITTNDMSKDENYEKVCDIIDIDSFIDYYAVESYIYRQGDWPKSNVAMWRSRYTSDNPYEDGRWRWMLFDVNSTSMGAPSAGDSIAYAKKHCDLFGSLYENEEFRDAFHNRLIDLATNSFAPENVNQKLDEYEELMDEPMEKHFQRFFGTSNEKFHEGIEELRYFFENRGEYIMGLIEAHE